MELYALKKNFEIQNDEAEEIYRFAYLDRKKTKSMQLKIQSSREDKPVLVPTNKEKDDLSEQIAPNFVKDILNEIYDHATDNINIEKETLAKDILNRMLTHAVDNVEKEQKTVITEFGDDQKDVTAFLEDTFDMVSADPDQKIDNIYQETIVLIGDFDAIPDKDRWINDCSKYLQNEKTKCTSIYKGSVGVHIQSESKLDSQLAIEKIIKSCLRIDFMNMLYCMSGTNKLEHYIKDIIYKNKIENITTNCDKKVLALTQMFENEKWKSQIETLNGIEKNRDELKFELKTKKDKLINMSTIMNSYHENADINIINSTNSCEQYYDIWKKTTTDWDDRTVIDLRLANKCFKDVFEIKILNAINGIEKKLAEITSELKTKENRLGNMNTIMDSYHENVDIKIIKSTNSCEQYYESWKTTAINWDDRTIIDPQLANKCFKDVFDITKLNAIEELQTSKEILEKILISVCAFFIVVIGIFSYCICRKHITLHKQITELKKTNTYSDLSTKLSVPLGTTLGPTYIPRSRSYECGTQDKLKLSSGRKLKHDVTTSTTYYYEPQKLTYQQELKRRTISISPPSPAFSLLEEYKPYDSNTRKFNSILSNSEIQSCDYQSTMDAESA